VTHGHDEPPCGAPGSAGVGEGGSDHLCHPEPSGEGSRSSR